MYLPQRQSGAVDLESLPDLKLRLGLCAKSGGKLEVCRKCGAPCSFGRILMERQDKRSAGQETVDEVKPNNVPDGRINEQKEPAVEVKPNAAPVERKEQAKPERKNQTKPKKPKMSREEWLAHRREWYKQYKKDPVRLELARMYSREYMRKKRIREREAGREEREAKKQAEVERMQAEAERTDLDVKHTFAARICWTMHQRDMSRAEFGRRLDVASTCVSAYCNGKNLPTMGKMYDICKVLDVSADYLLGLEVRS